MTLLETLNCTPFVRQYGILFRKWGCFCMPKGQRKYNGAQKVEIIKQLHNEKLSFMKRPASMEFQDVRFKIGSASIWKKAKRHFW